MQRIKISRNNLFDETQTLFSLSQVYHKPKDGVTPLIEINSTGLDDKFEDNADYSKYISIFNINDDGIFNISIDDLLSLGDNYFFKEKEYRNIADINSLQLYQLDRILKKIQTEELIVFNVSAFYQEIKTDESHGNSKYKEYQSFFSEIEDKVNFTMTDDFIYDEREYPSNTLFIFADYNQTDFIIRPYASHQALVKLPINDESKVHIGTQAQISMSYSLKMDNIEISDHYKENVEVLTKTKQVYDVVLDGNNKHYEHNYVICMLDTHRDISIDSIGVVFAKNPHYSQPFKSSGPEKAMIPYLYVYFNPQTHRIMPSFKALGLDYVEDSLPIYHYHYANEDSIDDQDAKIDYFTLLGDDTKWDYLNDHTMRLPLPDFANYRDYPSLKTIMEDLFQQDEITKIMDSIETVGERQKEELKIFNDTGESQDLFGITSSLNSIFKTNAHTLKDIIGEDNTPYIFRPFSRNENPLENEIKFTALFTFTIYNPPTTINIPFSQTFDTNTNQDEIVSDLYINRAIDNSVNGIIDMERDVYIPFWLEKDKGVLTKLPVREIEYRFHFKKRDDNFKLVNSGNEWNNTSANSGSDPLGFLGFSNKDVYYMKSSLKKTFIRSSFYDTPYTGNQEMLCYNTSFIDYRSLYQQLAHNPDSSVYVYSDDKRLDSSIKVKDKYSSKNSSEGFYIHVWRNNDVTELYNSIEFNNAKFGITSPMMLLHKDTPYPKTLMDLSEARHIKWIAEYDHDLKQHIYYIDNEWAKQYDGISFQKLDNATNKYIGKLIITLWEIHLDQN